MRRFIIFSALVVTGVAAALACGPWMRPSYYMFSVYNRNQIGETYTKGMLDYWQDYCTEASISPYDISQLAWVSPQIDDFEKSDNQLIKAAIAKGDTEMQQYLQLLCSYLQVSEQVKGDTWSYPTKHELADRNNIMNYIYNRARSYGGNRLKAQYDLLAMRALMIKKDYAGIIQWWKTRVSKAKASVFRDMAEGIYAHALLKTGKQREACEIYAQLGDMRSIKWMMQDKRNLQGIKDEYRANPNSPTLVFLVQDYVNNAQSTLESLRSGEASLASGVTYDGFEAEVRQMRQAAAGLRDFIPFAQQVVKEKKTQVPALWMSAAGHLEALLGNNAGGIKLLDQAMKLKGTERMIDNARVCRMMATVPGAQPTQQYLDYLKGELEWLTYAEGNEYDNQAWQYGLNGENHYSEMIVNLCYDYLGPKFIEQGNANLGLALMSWCDSHERDFVADREAAAYTMSRDCYWAIDNLTADQMISFQRYMASQPNSALEQYLRSQMGPNMFGDNYFNDKIGTKLLREGRFDEAIPWLEQVDTRYLSSLKISAYMAWRDYKRPRWFNKQTLVTINEEPTEVKTNQKLDFARDMVDAIARVGTTTGNNRAQAKYDLATMYFQASCKGNCWYLTRYANSVNDEPLDYPDEKDFVGEAVRLLDEAAAEATTFDLRQQCIYASAYIPWGEPFITYTYDSDYNQVPHYNTDTHEYRAMSALADFYRANSGKCSTYVSRCNTLRKFID